MHASLEAVATANVVWFLPCRFVQYKPDAELLVPVFLFVSCDKYKLISPSWRYYVSFTTVQSKYFVETDEFWLRIENSYMYQEGCY